MAARRTRTHTEHRPAPSVAPLRHSTRVAITLFVRTGIVLYAFLVPAMYAGLLMHERTALLMERETPLANALKFLHSSYVPQYWFWELIEVRACIEKNEPASAPTRTHAAPQSAAPSPMGR